MTATEPQLQEGRIVGIAGPVVDIQFPPNALPPINSGVEFDVTVDGETTVVMAEVAQHLGDGRIRVVSLKPTDGLRRAASPFATWAMVSRSPSAMSRSATSGT
ncbi:MAG: hypothetical protein R2706_00115 [Acidimicrobiales bacterium]